MAKKKTAQQILKEEMPNYRLVEEVATPDAAAVRSVADAASLPLDQLRQKFLGQQAGMTPPPHASDKAQDEEPAELRVVVPKNADVRGMAGGAKTVVIKGGKRTGVQG